jgi:hypothetical protein
MAGKPGTSLLTRLLRLTRLESAVTALVKAQSFMKRSGRPAGHEENERASMALSKSIHRVPNKAGGGGGDLPGYQA